jgi:hypothetical protein
MRVAVGMSYSPAEVIRIVVFIKDAEAGKGLRTRREKR